MEGTNPPLQHFQGAADGGAPLPPSDGAKEPLKNTADGNLPPWQNTCICFFRPFRGRVQSERPPRQKAGAPPAPDPPHRPAAAQNTLRSPLSTSSAGTFPQEGSKGAGVLGQERRPGDAEELFAGGQALPGQQPVGGHGALAAHADLQTGEGSGRERGSLGHKEPPVDPGGEGGPAGRKDAADEAPRPRSFKPPRPALVRKCKARVGHSEVPRAKDPRGAPPRTPRSDRSPGGRREDSRVGDAGAPCVELPESRTTRTRCRGAHPTRDPGAGLPWHSAPRRPRRTSAGRQAGRARETRGSRAGVASPRPPSPSAAASQEAGGTRKKGNGPEGGGAGDSRRPPPQTPRGNERVAREIKMRVFNVFQVYNALQNMTIRSVSAPEPERDKGRCSR